MTLLLTINTYQDSGGEYSARTLLLSLLCAIIENLFPKNLLQQKSFFDLAVILEKNIVSQANFFIKLMLSIALENTWLVNLIFSLTNKQNIFMLVS